MYKRIVVAFDGSREGRSALREGALLARRCGAQIYLLAVVADTPGILVAEGAHAGAMAHQQDAYKGVLEEAVNGLKPFGITLEVKLVRGEPSQQIAIYAKQVQGDLVVVGHRKQSFLQRWWSGSTGAYLSDQLSCSLLIARAVISPEEFRAEIERMAPAPEPT